MKGEASRASDTPAFARLRHSMDAFEHVFCSFLRPLPRIRWGVDVGAAAGFSPSNWDFERGIARKIKYFPSCPVCARICARRFER